MTCIEGNGTNIISLEGPYSTSHPSIRPRAWLSTIITMTRTEQTISMEVIRNSEHVEHKPNDFVKDEATKADEDKACDA